MSNLKNKSYDTNQLSIFTYAKSGIDSTWRSEILTDLHSKFPNKIYSGISINDSYDLEFTKYKHFETINDYSYRNYNLVFETIDYRNPVEYFLTEKTFKALFFNNPFYLIAPTEVVKLLSKDLQLIYQQTKYRREQNQIRFKNKEFGLQYQQDLTSTIKQYL